MKTRVVLVDDSDTALLALRRMLELSGAFDHPVRSLERFGPRVGIAEMELALVPAASAAHRRAVGIDELHGKTTVMQQTRRYGARNASTYDGDVRLFHPAGE